MILVDTSAWVEFLRDTGSSACQRVDDLLDDDIATCHPIRMEVLAGARDEQHLNDLRRLLARASLLPTRAPDYEQAAALFLIAATAIRLGISVLHADSDFDVLARHTDLQIDAL